MARGWIGIVRWDFQIGVGWILTNLDEAMVMAVTAEMRQTTGDDLIGPEESVRSYLRQSAKKATRGVAADWRRHQALMIRRGC